MNGFSSSTSVVKLRLTLKQWPPFNLVITPTHGKNGTGGGEGEQNMAPQNMPLRCNGYFELKAVEKKQI